MDRHLYVAVLDLCAAYDRVLMDTVAEEVASVSDSVSEHPAQLFADDVKLHAKREKALQKTLGIATTWPAQNSVKWNTHFGNSEVVKYKGVPKAKGLVSRPGTTSKMESLFPGSLHG